jgi:hypothetical protein
VDLNRKNMGDYSSHYSMYGSSPYSSTAYGASNPYSSATLPPASASTAPSPYGSYASPSAPSPYNGLYGGSALKNRAGGGAGDVQPDTLTGGATLRVAATDAKVPLDKGMEKVADIPAEFFSYYTYKSVRCGFVGSVLITFALFVITIGAIANILVSGDGIQKWGWAIMWGFGILLFVFGCIFLGMCWSAVPTYLGERAGVSVTFSASATTDG